MTFLLTLFETFDNDGRWKKRRWYYSFGSHFLCLLRFTLVELNHAVVLNFRVSFGFIEFGVCILVSTLRDETFHNFLLIEKRQNPEFWLKITYEQIFGGQNPRCYCSNVFNGAWNAPACR